VDVEDGHRVILQKTGGRADGTYGPTGPVLRDQMGSFLARTLDLFVANGARLPA
jgi:hypothetical protein